jgi:hypothetical protein
MSHVAILSVLLAKTAMQPGTTHTNEPPPPTDYMAMLGEDDIQGKKSGMLTGNKV